MSDCQIHYMDIVADACTVMSRIIVSKYAQTLQLAHCHLRNIGNQIVGDTLRILSDQAALMSSDWIEIAQQNHVPLRISHMEICENLLQHALGLAVRIGNLALRAVLCNRHEGRISIYSGGGAEYNILDSMISHHIAQDQGACNVIMIVLQRLCHRLAYCLQSCEMNDRIDFFCIKNFIEGLAVQNVRLIKFHRFSRDLLYASYGFLTGIAKIVSHYYFVACL